MYTYQQPPHYGPRPQGPAPWPALPAAPEPIFRVHLIKHTGLLIMWQQQSYTVTGTYAQCEAAIRVAQQHHLGAGWWSPLSVLLMNWIAIFHNRSVRTTVRRNAAQVRMYAVNFATQQTAHY